MQKENPRSARRGSIETNATFWTLQRPEISDLRQCHIGQIRWAFDLTIGPIEIKNFVVSVDHDGRPKAISPPSIRDARTKLRFNPIRTDPAFLDELLEAVNDRLAAEEVQAS